MSIVDAASEKSSALFVNSGRCRALVATFEVRFKTRRHRDRREKRESVGVMSLLAVPGADRMWHRSDAGKVTVEKWGVEK